MQTKKAGFSLVEMLVAVILLTLLIGVAIFAFKYQLLTIHKTQKVGINKVLKYSQLRASLESIKYYVVDDYDMLNYPMKNLHLFFNGTKTQIDYITTNTLFSKEIALVKLECIDNSLVYQEEPLYGDIDFLRPELKEDSRKKTFYNNLDSCEFRYIKKDVVLESFIDAVPDKIVVNFSSIKFSNKIYVDIKSDNNTSVREVRNAIYPVE